MISAVATSLVFALLAPVGPLSTAPTQPLAPGTPPEVSAVSWAIYDETAHVMLATWNLNEQRPMASVTKIMTAMVVVDHADLEDVVTVPSLATGTRGSSAGLVAGEEWTVYDLLVAMLVRSGNDAALTLAWHVGGGDVDAFVPLMNDRAAEIGMDDTHFMNPNGLDHADHYSTANDLVTLTLASLDYPVIQQISRIKTIKMPADPTGKVRNVTERGPRRIVTVVMGSDDHFTDSRELIDWAYATYGLRDRWLRPFFSEQGGGAVVADDLGLSESEERRLGAMPRIDDGRWRMSALTDLPKAALITEWLKTALPSIIGGDG